jgi:hypothetical protein
MTTAKIGDRVRLTPSQRHPDYHAGDSGTVEQVEAVGGASGLPLYHVRLDRDGKVQTFYGEELELAP